MSLAITVLGLVVSVLLAQWASKRQRDYHLDSIWRGIMGLVDQNPDFSDVSKCRHYLKEFDWHTRLRYDVFCLQAWMSCYAMATSLWPLSNNQRLVIDWMATYHDEWLRGNSHLFTSRRFWSLIESIREEELKLTVHRPVPGEGTLAQWQELMPRYFETFLSPYDPSIPIERRFGSVVEDFIERFEEPPTVLDLGCRVGSSFPFLTKTTDQFFGADSSPEALKICEGTHGETGLTQSTVTEIPVKDSSVDCVIAANSILLNSRSETKKAFSEIGRILKPNGRALLLLPSYESMQYLRQLRIDNSGPHNAQQDRVAESFDYLRQMQDSDASYKDDGVTRQYFHTTNTISQEINTAGLRLTAEVSKFHYPWKLTRSYNYGFFPGKEEMWDWVVQIEKTSHK